MALLVTPGLHHHPLAPLAVEFGVEHLLPRTEIELACRDRQHHLVAHDRALEVRIGIVFARLMMAVIQSGRSELLEPRLEVVGQAVFPVVDVHAGGNVSYGRPSERKLRREIERRLSSMPGGTRSL